MVRGNESLFTASKMAATPIYGKNPSKIFSEPADRFPRNLICSVGDFLPTIVYSNDDPGLALTYFMARSSFVALAFL